MKSIYSIKSFGVIEHKNGNIIRINEKGASIPGYQPDELAGKNFLQFTDETGRQEFKQMVRSGFFVCRSRIAVPLNNADPDIALDMKIGMYL